MMSSFGCLDGELRRGHVLGQLEWCVLLLRSLDNALSTPGAQSSSLFDLSSCVKLLAAVSEQVSHQDLVTEIDPLLAQMSQALQDAYSGNLSMDELLGQARLWIKIIIKIGKVTIIIQW